MEATVIVAKCKNSKDTFGIRTEQRSNAWVFTWAFKMTEKAAASEGYNLTNISGAIRLDTDYPGCPHCESKGFTQCGRCNKIACYRGHEEKVTCPHCGNTAHVSSAESFEDIKGGAF